MIPREVFVTLATLGLSQEQAEIVVDMLHEVEAATKVDSGGSEVLERQRAKARERWARWRARVKLSATDWLRLGDQVKERDHYTCQYCGTKDGPLHADHVIPLSQGGTNDLTNLVAACEACNCGKSGRTPEQWRA